MAEYTFFSSAHRTFSRIDPILGHKSSLRKFKKIEIISSTFSDHNTMRLEINYRKKTCKNHRYMEAKQCTTKYPRDHWRNQRRNKKIHRNKWQQKHNDPKPMGHSRSSSKREAYSNSISLQETRKISDKQSNLTPKATRERRTKKTQAVEGKKSQRSEQK